MKNAIHAAWAALVILCGLSASFAAGASTGSGDRPVVSGLEIVQSGTFAPLPPETSPGGARYRLVRSGETVEAAPGVAFGVAFAVKGEPAGQAVVVEARLSPPEAEGGTATGTDGAPEPGRRWFIPAVVGGTGQAVASFAYAWEAVPGPWRLTLAEGGRVLDEKIFSVGEGSAAPSGTAPPVPSVPPVAPVSPSPDSGGPPNGISSEPVAGTAAAENPAEPLIQQQPPAASLPAAPEPPVDPVNVRNGQGPVPAKTEKPAAKAPSASAQAPTAKAAEPAADAKPPAKAAPKPASKPDEVAGTGKGTTFLLQAGLFSVKGNAFSEAARYRAKGYPACVLEEGNGAKRRYRVIVGRFPDNERAVTARRAFLAREGGEVVVKELPAAEVSGRLFCR
ncbi:MAG: SPOR domain-containing protein [Thermodesulfobacteriota bacterium]